MLMDKAVSSLVTEPEPKIAELLMYPRQFAKKTAYDNNC